jgi:hypothetical protein
MNEEEESQALCADVEAGLKQAQSQTPGRPAVTRRAHRRRPPRAVVLATPAPADPGRSVPGP